MKKLNDIYLEKILDIFINGDIVFPRMNESKELLNQSIILEDINDNIITLNHLKTNIDYAKEELKWFREGDNLINFSDKINRIWHRYSDDGISVNSNYGTRIFKEITILKMSQWEWCKKKLIEDAESRQAIINLNNMYDKIIKTKDFVCGISMQFFIRKYKLNMIFNIRSNDIYKGFRNDIYTMTELQKQMANELNIETGSYFHNAASLHLYKEDYFRILPYL